MFRYLSKMPIYVQKLREGIQAVLVPNKLNSFYVLSDKNVLHLSAINHLLINRAVNFA